MPPEIVALIDKPLLLALVIGLGVVCGMFAERINKKLLKAKRRAYWDKRNDNQKIGMAARAGRSSSEAKAAAARVNGAKGRRPR